MKQTFEILQKSGEAGLKAYIIENFRGLVEAFSETLSFFPVEQLAVFTGAEGSHQPISAIHPNAIADEKNKLIAGAISSTLGKEPTSKPQLTPAPSKNRPAKSTTAQAEQPSAQNIEQYLLQDLTVHEGLKRGQSQTEEEAIEVIEDISLDDSQAQKPKKPAVTFQKRPPNAPKK